jgi:hypothetical protein
MGNVVMAGGKKIGISNGVMPKEGRQRGKKK